MLYLPQAQGELNWHVTNFSSARPAPGGGGTTVTPGNNTKGSWVECLSGATVAREVFSLSLYVNNSAVAGQSRDAILDVGIDPTGGSNYTVIIPNLIVSNAGAATFSPRGHNYRFPIRIPAGSSIAVRMSVNNATVGTARVYMRAFGGPRDRREVKFGTHVTAYGITAASSNGTAVTSGTTSEGAWTALGVVARDEWYWQLGVGCSGTGFTTQLYHADLAIGDASNKQIVIDELPILFGSSANDIAKMPTDDGFFKATAGQTIYGRLWCSSTPPAGLSMSAYGLGG